MRNINSEEMSFLPVVKEQRYFCLSMAAILLSMLFPAVEFQLLAIAMLTGLKWIVQGRNGRTIIIMKGGVENVGSSEIMQTRW